MIRKLTLAVMLVASVAKAQPREAGGGDKQALADLLDAYSKDGNSRHLLDIARAQRRLDWSADAANTYARYLADPTASDQAEVKARLASLEADVATITVRVVPERSELSIDGGPFVGVGKTLEVRVRPGPHLVRIHNGEVIREVLVVGFGGQAEEVLAMLGEDPPRPRLATTPPDHVIGWLVDGTRYSSPDANGRERHLRSTFGGTEIAASAPPKPEVPAPVEEVTDEEKLAPVDEPIASGVMAIIRVDGNHLQGFAGGLGGVYAVADPVELEGAILKSEVWGTYVGARYRLLTQTLRPYVALGLPMFYFSDDSNMSHIAVGLRLAIGLEVKLSTHLSVEGDLGGEHFLNASNIVYSGKAFDENYFTPTLGFIGRM